MDLLAEQGKLRLYTMRIGSQAVASVYGIVHGGEFIYFQAGYDPDWRTHSVGLVLVGETFKDAIEAGLRGYDFLRGTEAYKSDWVTQQRRTVALRIHERRGRGAWLGRSERAGKRVRDAAKAVLPTRLIELIRRVRRRRRAI
jgi:CelD/BcsL family acetyltransferase involved in cellulose biosynthesis